MSLVGVRLKDFLEACLRKMNDKGLIFIRKRNETQKIIGKYKEKFHNSKKKKKIQNKCLGIRIFCQQDKFH